jgi:hypothetical protein
MFNGTTIISASDFTPDSNLYVKDADITLIFLSGNGVISTTPIHDPWYRMSKPIRPVHRGEAETPTMAYGMDISASPLGCATQYQFCKSDPSSCGPLSSAMDALAGAAPMFNTTSDVLLNGTPGASEVVSRMQWMMSVLESYPASAYAVVMGQGVTSLVARQGMWGGVQGSLPDDQWKAEVTSWWITILSSWQSMLVETAHGLTDPALANFRGLPQDEYQQDMCYNQVRMPKEARLY